MGKKAKAASNKKASEDCLVCGGTGIIEDFLNLLSKREEHFSASGGRLAYPVNKECVSVLLASLTQNAPRLRRCPTSQSPYT